jgi:outer membrane protein OmpA-like peptidoglycan-associated protein/outer membrane protein W
MGHMSAADRLPPLPAACARGASMKTSAFLAWLAAGTLFAFGASAQDFHWVVKGGAHYLMPKSSNGHVEFDGQKYGVEVDDAASVTFSVSYMFSDQWALELFGSGPFQHDIDIRGFGEVETSHVPPILSAVYYFNSDGRIRPYLGAGINVTTFFDEDPDDLNLGDSVGPALTAGVDFGITRNWFATLDLRWINIETEVKFDGSQRDYGTVDINPLGVGLMVGYRFGGRDVPTYEAPAVAAAPAPAVAAEPAAPAACPDGDGDKVCDADDRCPNTPAGDTVDPYGCSLVSRLAVYFDFDRAELRPESITELERVVKFMNDIPTVTALIEGHTDSMGTDAYNLELSDRRAKAVYDYLASRGISPSRLQTVGKGEAEPIADNATDAGRQLNRRVMLIRTDGGR